MSLPLDQDGYVRRQCPQCEREFKWHHGPIEGAPIADAAPEDYFCPYCGESAAPDQWYTREQVATIRGTAMQAVLPEIQSELQEAVAPLQRSGFIKADVVVNHPSPPPPLLEGDDMVAVASPCHAYEPVKVDEAWDAPLHCLVCGNRYVVG